MTAAATAKSRQGLMATTRVQGQKKHDRPLEASEGARPCHLALRLVASSLRGDECLCAAPQFVVICYSGWYHGHHQSLPLALDLLAGSVVLQPLRP